MTQPVLTALKRRGNYQCRVISLCEFRGFASPSAQFTQADAFIPVLARPFRRSPATGKQAAGARRWLRHIARRLSWHLLLQRPLQRTLSSRPNLVVLPNDTAFPYNHIVQQLHGRRIPFLLMQEGIRFPLPVDKGHNAYGSGGAAAIAAWGEISAAYFQAQGAPPATIYCTGSPRFDPINCTNWQPLAAQLKAENRFGKTNLLLLSNPIDDQGFCTTHEKIALIRRFVTEIAPLFNDPAFHLIIKLHARESASDFQAVAQDSPFPERITILEQTALYPLFLLVQAAVVLASTVGLEALLFKLPLAVLEIPGAGFVHDYVHRGAATGLSWQRPLAPQVLALLTGQGVDTAVATAYLQHSLAIRTDAAGCVADLIAKLTA